MNRSAIVFILLLTTSEGLWGQIPVVDATSILTQTLTDYDIVMTADLSLESSERLNSVLKGLSDRFFGNGTADKAALATDLLDLTSEMASYSSRILQAEALVKQYNKDLGNIRSGSDVSSAVNTLVFSAKDYYVYSDELYRAIRKVLGSQHRTVAQKQDAIEKAKSDLESRGLQVLDSVSIRVAHMESARSLALWIRETSSSLDAKEYSSAQQSIYGKSLKGNAGGIAFIIVAIVLLVCVSEAVFSISKYFSGEKGLDELVKRILLCTLGILLSLSVLAPLV